MQATVVLEIKIYDDIKEKYPNFISNYASKEHFLQEYIENLNNNSDYGYEQKVVHTIFDYSADNKEV